MKSAYIIEFTGVSGVGKTYIRSMLIQHLTKYGIDCGTTKLKYIDLFKINTLLIFYNTLKLLMIGKPKSINRFIDSFRRWSIMQMLFYKVKNCCFGEIVVIDEGFFHKLRCVRRNSNEKVISGKIKENIKSNIYLPNMVVVVHAKHEDINSRKYNRDGVTVNRDSEKIRKSMLLSVNDVSSFKEVKLIEYDNSTEVYAEFHKKQLDFIVNSIKMDIERLNVL